MAGKWRRRFVVADVDGLHDGPRAPRSISDADVERVIVTTLEQQPTDAHPAETRSGRSPDGARLPRLSNRKMLKWHVNVPGNETGRNPPGPAITVVRMQLNDIGATPSRGSTGRRPAPL